jgi:hypothetical protein
MFCSLRQHDWESCMLSEEWNCAVMKHIHVRPQVYITLWVVVNNKYKCNCSSLKFMIKTGVLLPLTLLMYHEEITYQMKLFTDPPRNGNKHCMFPRTPDDNSNNILCMNTGYVGNEMCHSWLSTPVPDSNSRILIRGALSSGLSSLYGYFWYLVSIDENMHQILCLY